MVRVDQTRRDQAARRVKGVVCVRRWIGPDGEYRRDVLQKRWVLKESTDAAGRKLPPASGGTR